MINFFRIEDKGSIRKPTMVGLMVFFAYMIAVMAIMRDSIVMALILIGVGYVVIMSIFSKPLRFAISGILFRLRSSQLVSAPLAADNRWFKTNRETLERANLRIFNGTEESPSKKDVKP